MGPVHCELGDGERVGQRKEKSLTLLTTEQELELKVLVGHQKTSESENRL